MSAARVGVLALQGGVAEHERMLAGLGATPVPVRSPAHLVGLDALVIPGGESSVLDRLVDVAGLREPLLEAVGGGLPTLGTCAGLVLLAARVENPAPGQRSLGVLDVTVRRNAFGSQNQSFETQLEVPEVGEPPVHATFIRGPVVDTVGARARVMASLPDGRVVAVAQGNLLGTSFHPEMNGETRFHSYFLDRVAEHAA